MTRRTATFGIGGVDAGYTYIGQFIDHDITLGDEGDLSGRVDPGTVTNQRTAAFDPGLGLRWRPTRLPADCTAVWTESTCSWATPRRVAGATDTDATDPPARCARCGR
jgi:hypothetical protein